jgi:hypothetical protein
MRRLVILAILALSSAPGALAQADHQHGGGKGMAAVLHDGPDDGRAVVGSLTHFGFALLDGGVPAVHRDARFVVEQDNVTVFSTEDTHEYDGLFSFDLTFTRPGPYVVMAMSDGFEMGRFAGEVVEPVHATEASIDLRLASLDGVGTHAFTAVLDIVGPDGARLPHTDAIVETRSVRTGALASRMHLHIHNDPIAFVQGLGLDGDYNVHVVAYKAFATGKGFDMKAITADVPVSVGPLAVPALPTPDATAAQPLQQLGANATGGGLILQATYDPEAQIGVGQDFAMELHGPRGLVFRSSSLHEYDGVLEYLFVPTVPGIYEGSITAVGTENVTVPLRFQVVPPAVALGKGIGLVGVDGLGALAAGTPTNVTFSVMGKDGPVQHSEVDVTIFHDAEPPVYQFKLHTHESGLTHATLLLPHAGDWTMIVDPLPTAPEPVLFQGPAGLGQPIRFAFTVAAGHLASDVAGAAKDAAGPRTVPAVAPLALVALALVAGARRR